MMQSSFSTKGDTTRKRRRHRAILYFLVLFVLLDAFFDCYAIGKETQSSASDAAQQKRKYPVYWPPLLNSYYPGIELVSLSGTKVNLSSFSGKVLLIEPIGMTCPGCQAFVGGSRKGGFGGITPQPGLDSIDELLRKNGISPQDRRLQRVQLLLYSMSMKAPTLAEARSWSDHFGFGKGANETVLIGDSRFTNPASYNMIPGFQLVDQNFVLRSDATGHNPKSDLYRDLIPQLKKLLP